MYVEKMFGQIVTCYRNPNLKQSFFKNGQIVNLAKKLLKSDKILKDCFDLGLCMSVF